MSGIIRLRGQNLHILSSVEPRLLGIKGERILFGKNKEITRWETKGVEKSMIQVCYIHE